MFQCCFHPSTNESESVFPALICVNNLSVKKKQGNMGRPGHPGPTGPPGQGLQGPKVRHCHTQIIKSWPCIYVFISYSTILYSIAGWSGVTGSYRAKRTSWRRNAGVKGLRYCYIITLCCDWIFIQFINKKTICVFQGDRGGQGERGMKGVKGDMGDPGVSGQTVSKLTSALTELLPEWSISNQS